MFTPSKQDHHRSNGRIHRLICAIATGAYFRPVSRRVKMRGTRADRMEMWIRHGFIEQPEGTILDGPRLKPFPFQELPPVTELA